MTKILIVTRRQDNIHSLVTEFKTLKQAVDAVAAIKQFNSSSHSFGVDATVLGET